MILIAEYQPANNELGRVVRFKFAFRWCEEQVCSHISSCHCYLISSRANRGGMIKRTKRGKEEVRTSIRVTQLSNVVPGIDHAELSSDSGYSSGEPNYAQILVLI